MNDQSVPKVSIGVPVYNGAATLSSMFDALAKQTYSNYEIVISDNGSTDATADICVKYAAQDERIRYYRQPQNIGAEPNFKAVLDLARSPYFMWSSADDTRSPEYLEENVRFLEANPGYVASTCPNIFEGHASTPGKAVAFSIEGDVPERFNTFFDNCWSSHGIFYAVMRTDVLRGCDIVGQSFLGADWAIDLYVASRGNINRTRKGLMILGAAGISSSSNRWRRYRTNPSYWLLPFYRVSLYALKLADGFTPTQRAYLLMRLLRLNMWAAYCQFVAEVYPFYSSKIKPWIRRA